MSNDVYRTEFTSTNPITLFCNDSPMAFFSCRSDGWHAILSRRVVSNKAAGTSRIGHPTILEAARRFSGAAKQSIRAFEDANRAKIAEISARHHATP